MYICCCFGAKTIERTTRHLTLDNTKQLMDYVLVIGIVQQCMDDTLEKSVAAIVLLKKS